MEAAFHRRFILQLALGLIVLLGLAVLLNRAANPYCLFATDWLPSKSKPETFTHLRLVKAMQVRHVKPQAVILGSSRAETGLSPEHAGWKARPAYNLGLSDARLYEIKSYFEFACSQAQVKQAMLLLDFTAFLPGGRNSPDFSEERLQGFSAEDYLLGLCSWDATSGSLNTLLGRQGEKSYLANGSRDVSVENARVKAKGGALRAFLAYEKRFMTAGTAPTRLDEEAQQVFRDILAVARRHSVDLRLAVAPVHARYLEMLDRCGQAALFEEWKKWITAEVEKEAVDSKQSAFPLLDFSGYNEFTTEPVPEKGLATYYLESSHFTQALGDKLLDRLFSDEAPAGPGAFGFRMSSAQMGAHLTAIRETRERYRRERAEELASLQQPQ